MNTLIRSPRFRAAALFVLVLLFDALLYLPLLALGVMATDGCSGVDFGPWGYYLTVAWPLLLLAGALIAPLLVLRRARWYWVAAGWMGGVLLGGAGFLGWLVIVTRFCGGSL